MHTITHTPHATRTAAVRARVLSCVLEDRAAHSPARETLTNIAFHLTVAACHLESEGAPVIGGVTHTVESDVWTALRAAENSARQTAGLAYLADLVTYVETPLTRRLPYLPALTGAAAQESKDARGQIDCAARTLSRTSTGDPVTMYAVLATLADLHAHHDGLAHAADATA